MADRGIFSFFKLARELRDLIYEQLLVDEHLFELRNGVNLKAQHVPIPALLQINRQFYTEYSSLAQKHFFLAVQNQTCIISHRRLPKLPPAATAIHRLLYNITACNSFQEALAEMEFHNRCLNDMLKQTRSVEQVSVHVNLGSGINARDYESAILWSGYWTRMEKLKELLIYRMGKRSTIAGPNDAPKTLLKRWDAEKGVFVREVEEGDQDRSNVWLTTQREAWVLGITAALAAERS